VQEYRQTAGVWVRGILAHEYGVDLSTIKWFEGGVNEPRPPDQDMDLRPVRELSIALIPLGRTISDMLEQGEIDAYFGARRPAALDNGRNVARLFPDYRAREKEYYRRTNFHPIMHTLVIREDLHRAEPWVAESLYKACEESKRWMLREMRFSGAQRFMFPWLFDEIAEMDELMGKNPWPYGVEANRAMLTAFNGYLVEQGFLERTLPLEELFTPIIGWAE
jgi:4,5-dihydroxyphthalate decarboxylase